MKITAVKTVLLTGPCTNDPFLREVRKLRSAAFIEIHTDRGLVGLGETYLGYFIPEAVPEIVKFFAPILVGQEVTDPIELWDRMYFCGNFWARVGMGTAVVNGIEAALWDLKGKMAGVPVYEMLGGRRHEKLPCYATGGPCNYPKDRLVAKIDHYLSLGFRGVKLSTGSYSEKDGWFMPGSPSEAADFEGDKMAFVRSRYGKDVKIMLDGHMGNSPDNTWDLDTARAAVKAIEPFDVFFFEEPLPYTNPREWGELCRGASTPIAGGECLTAAYEWRVFINHDSFDIGQPDASFTGGMGEFMKVAAMLESRGRKVATHSWGAAGSFMQNLHCGFASSNTVILETAPDYAGLHSDLMAEPFTMKDGMASPPTSPGLGIVLTDEIKNRYRFKPGTGEFNEVPGKVLVNE